MSRFAVTALLLLGGCSAERRALRADKREIADLGERAQRCWDAIRWSNTSVAAGCVDGSDNRVAFQAWLASAAKDERIDEVEVLHVSVTPLKDPPGDDGRLREASVTIRKDAYRMPDQVLRSESFEQTWYEVKSGWYLEWP